MDFIEWLKTKEAELHAELRAGEEFKNQNPRSNFFLDKNAKQRERIAAALNLYDEFNNI